MLIFDLGAISVETIGTVVSLHESKAEIEVQRVGACTGSCKDCSGCETKKMYITVDVPDYLKIGDRVRIFSSTRAVLLGYFIIFIIPIIVPATVYLLTSNGGLRILFTLLAVILSTSLVLILNKSKKFSKRIQPRFIEVISK